MMALTKNYVNAYNKSSCLLREDGSYYEGTAYNYAFRMLPDMDSRIALCGGKSQFVAHMDKFFGYETEAPLIQLPIVPWQGAHEPFLNKVASDGFASHTYEGLCNEPDMETPYSYSYAGMLLAEMKLLSSGCCCRPNRPSARSGNCCQDVLIFARAWRSRRE